MPLRFGFHLNHTKIKQKWPEKWAGTSSQWAGFHCVSISVAGGRSELTLNANVYICRRAGTALGKNERDFEDFLGCKLLSWRTCRSGK